MKFTIGQQIALNNPYKGYRNAEIIGYEFPQYQIRLSNGLEISVYEDETKIRKFHYV